MVGPITNGLILNYTGKRPVQCFDKILKFRQGKTMLCASHQSEMVQRLCARGVWLYHGQLVLDGPLAEVIDAYEGRLRSNSNS